MKELNLNPTKTALVLIDLQNGVMGMNPAPHSSAQVAEKSRMLAEAARAKAMPVVYVRVDVNDFADIPADEPSRFRGQQLPAELSEISEAAGKQRGDLLITKRHWGAFGGTNLEAELRSRGVDTVVITGIATNMGVESTVREGTGLGFAFVIVEDACSAHSLEHHQFAFQNIFPRIGRVRSTAEVLTEIA